jgi:hypothetical protein
VCASDGLRGGAGNRLNKPASGFSWSLLELSGARSVSQERSIHRRTDRNTAKIHHKDTKFTKIQIDLVLVGCSWLLRELCAFVVEFCGFDRLGGPGEASFVLTERYVIAARLVARLPW